MAPNSHDNDSHSHTHPPGQPIPLQDLSGFNGAYVHGTEDVSPVEDPGSFAQAMSSVGLGYHGSPFHSPARSRDNVSEWDSVQLDNYSTHELDNFSEDTDTAPLTDRRYLQPISGAPGSSRRHGPSDRGTGHTGSRLGDDLPRLESGLGGRHRGSSSAGDRSRSLSPAANTGSALQRASTIVKSMSQRVVNVSNAPEVIEESIRTEESWKNSRMEEPPGLPAMSDYAHDAPTEDKMAEEKPPSRKAWRDSNNPLRGKSLGILSANNPLRVRLCDILVHPFTEPLILLVIVFQTVLLTVESTKPVWNSSRPHRESNSLFYLYLAIFIIYTLELIAKVLVSGFVLNPVEYSTLDRSLGFKEALSERAKNLITPHRQLSTKKLSMLPEQPQASILRTFTNFNQQEPEVVKDPLQNRRIRLAHRAFLRHSFNRLDFVAVVSFWISFVLSLSGTESTNQLYVFRMLSCLRILRLLALTNGTSVSRLAKERFHLLIRSGHHPKSQESVTPTCPCGFSHRLLLVAVCHCWHSEFQVKLPENLRLG